MSGLHGLSFADSLVVVDKHSNANICGVRSRPCGLLQLFGLIEAVSVTSVLSPGGSRVHWSSIVIGGRGVSIALCLGRLVVLIVPLIDCADKHLPAVAANSRFSVDDIVVSVVVMSVNRFQNALLILGGLTQVFRHLQHRRDLSASSCTRDYLQIE